MSWRTTRLGDVLTLQRGHDLPDSKRKDGDIPIVSSSGITGYHNEPKAQAPGVVTGRCGTIGEVFFLEEDYWPLNTALYVTDFKGNHPRFIAYMLRNTLRPYQSDKAAVPGVNRNVLHEISVLFPTFSIQERIVYILSAYDDLIANNRRRIQLLEESARLLYREWFVHLRFPGHEHTRIKDGIPEGWKRVPLGQLCDEVREICLPASMEPDTPYIGLEYMPRRSIALSEWGTAEQVTSSKHRYCESDILFGKIRPYFHKVGIALTEGIASSDAIVIRPISQQLLPLVLMVASSDAFVADTAQKMKEGAKMPRADWKQMTQYPVLYPTENILWALNDFIEPTLKQIKTLVLSSRNLVDARDLLLPKLMSGEVAV